MDICTASFNLESLLSEFEDLNALKQVSWGSSLKLQLSKNNLLLQNFSFNYLIC